MIHIECDINEEITRIGAIRLNTSDKSEIFGTIGAIMQKSIADQFISQGDRYGTPWQPIRMKSFWARKTSTRKKTVGGEMGGYTYRTRKKSAGKNTVDYEGYALGGYQILRDTDRLFSDIRPLRHTSGFVDIGTDLIYAGTHQFGNVERNIPARPFLPDELITEDEELINESIEAWYQRKIDEVS